MFNVNYRMIFTLLIGLFSSIIFTQPGHNYDYIHVHGKISGLLLNDITGDPIEYAIISISRSKQNLFVADDSSLIQGKSNKDGYFQISDMKPGKYRVIIECIGRETVELDNIKLIPPNMNIDLGTIRLLPKALDLDEITIEEKKAFIENKIDKKVYNVADEASTTGGSASDVLEQIPSITINVDGDIELRQNNKVTILINGRESNFGNNIDMLGADMIDRVEVITTPSAKYDPDGTAGIINIILSKNEYVGTSGNIKYHYGQRNNFGLSGSINFLKNNWNIFTNYNVNNKTKLGTGYRRTIFSNDNDDFILEDSFLSNSITYKYPENMNLKLGVENYLSDNETVAFDITFITHQGIDSTNTSTYYYSNPYLLSRATDIVNKNGDDVTFGFGYYNDLSQNEQLSFQFDFDDHDDYEIFNYIDLDNSSNNTINITDDKGSDRIFQLDYNRPIKNDYNDEDSRIETGIKINSNNDRKNQNYNENMFNYNYDRDRLSLYVNASYYFTESFGIQAGLRFETSKTNSTLNTFGFELDPLNSVFEWAILELGQDDLVYEYDYERIYPSLYFLYNMKEKGNLKFEFGRRINRPGEWSTNPFPTIDYDSYFIRQGNPYLRPEDVYKCELSYSTRTSIGFISAGIYFSRITNQIDRHLFIEGYDSAPGIPGFEDYYSILTWVNNGKTENSGFEIMLRSNPLPNWTLMVSGNYWYDNILEATEEDMLGVESGFWGFTKSTFKLKNKEEIQLSGHFSTKMKITTGEIAPMKSLDFAYKKEVDERFNITLKVKDLFDSRKFEITTNQSYEYDAMSGNSELEGNKFSNAEFRRNKRTISLSFEYKFGEFKKKKYIRGDSHDYDRGGGDGMGAGY